MSLDSEVLAEILIRIDERLPGIGRLANKTVDNCGLGEPTSMLLMRYLCAIFSVLLLTAPALSDVSTSQVISVVDGDTIDVLHGERLERIRLNGIDAPEKGQDYGRRAKQFTYELVEQKEVRIESQGLDKYGRTIGDVFLMDGTHVNKELVKAGLAWWFCRHSSDEQLKQLEEEARDAKRGLWVDPVPIPPWVYRKLQRKQVPDVSDFDCPGQSPSTPMNALSSGPLQVIGNKRSHIYHRPDCPGYAKISANNQTIFPDAEAAEEAGYRLAANCPR